MVMKYATWTPWSRMVRRGLVEKNGVRFDGIPVGNDAMFVLRCTSLARRISVEKEVCYHYFQPSAGSQTWHKYTDSTFAQRTELRFRINELYRQVGYPFLWPITSKIHYKDLNASQREQLADICARYHHTHLKELRARASQLMGKLMGCL